jgi:hypothetical protein
MRDELTNARGSTAQLSARLNASLTPAGTLLPNIVTSGQIADNTIASNKIADNAIINTKIADNAVTAQKIADNAVTAQKIAANAVTTSEIVDNAVVANKIANNAVIAGKIAAQVVTEPTLANNSVSNRTIVPGAVSIAKLNAAQVVNLQVSVPAAPGPGQRSELVVTLQEADEAAFYLISVHFDGPRPVIPGASLRNFDWKHRVSLNKALGNQPYRHFHQVVIENPNTAEITVTVRAFRLAEN